MAEDPLRVVLCWHMHQPEYRDPRTGAFEEPWTLLHGLKDYTDMAAHLERVEGARAVVNFSPLVLEQLDALVGELDAFLEGGPLPAEPILAALVPEGVPEDPARQRRIVEACLRINHERLAERFPPLMRLIALARAVLRRPGAETWLDESFLGDLVGWYLLAWLGESVRRADPRARHLLACEQGFEPGERRMLLELVRDQLAGIAPRWRALADSGRVELACNPYAHPMLPLLIDFDCAWEARPATELPEGRYPDGEARARAHLGRARAVHEAHFGTPPAGCWPSEGGVSDAALRLIEEAGFRWTATGQQVLRHSLDAEAAGSDEVHRPWRLAGCDLPVFFRDDALSDAIGFTYQDWHADDAVADFIGHLERIADDPEAGPGRVVPVILDGENAWEYYPENAVHFLDALYRRLVEHPRIRLVTFGDVRAEREVPVGELAHVVAGSWVYGDFNTWIGDPQKNRAWELLLQARAAVDQAVADGAEWSEEAERRLAICEGSDWFWWPGEYNPADAVARFDALYRRHLAALYEAVGLEPPEALAASFAEGHGDPAAGGVMRGGG
jgi:alpha-amylase/alpha-mannosidase (GH57 family)